jgi:hypothetical protein
LRVRRSGGNRLVGGIGLRHRVRGVMADEGVNFSVHPGDLVEARLHDFARRDFAAGQPGDEFGNGELVEHQIFRPEEANIERRTSNAEHRIARPRCGLDVECFFGCMAALKIP